MINMINTGSFTKLVTASVFIIAAGKAGAAGFQIQEQSVKGLGNAFAGGSAIAEDASTAIYNPAGLTRFDSAHVEFGAHVIIPQSEFNNTSSTNGVGGIATGSGDDGGNVAVVPNTFYVRPLSENLSFGFAISSLYGLVTEYDRNWIGRYHAVKSDLLTVNINPSLGFRVNNQLSFGIGVSAQYADAELTNALDFGTLASLAGAPGATPSNPALDGFSKIEADGWAYGFNLGVLYELNDKTRFGLSYRSEIEHDVEGENHLTIPAFATALAGPSRTRGTSATVSSPATMSLSAYHEINEQWAVMADVTWTEWSSFDELRFSFDDGGADSVQPEQWDDVYRFSIGANYRYNDNWTFRTGIAYDQTPVPNAELRTPRIPDNSRRWLAFGASYRPSDTFSFDVAYTHIFVSDTAISNREETTGSLAGNAMIGSRLEGEYESSVDIISAQLQWNF